MKVRMFPALSVEQQATVTNGRTFSGTPGTAVDVPNGFVRVTAGRLALSRCRAASAKCRRLRNCQAVATAVRHVSIAAARSARCVWAEVRWRWTLKVL